MVGHQIAALIERLGRLQRGGEQVGALYPAQWEALRYLAAANRFSRTPSALTAFLGATKGTVSQTLKSLERRALVEASADPNDRRSKVYRLTELGRACLERDPIGRMAEGIAALDDDRRARLAEDLGALLAELQRRNGRRPFGQCRTCRFFRAHAAPGDPAGPHRCGLLDVPLSDHDSGQICLEQEPVQAA